MLKLGVQHYFTPALSKACHPQYHTKNSVARWQPYIYIQLTTAKQNLTFRLQHAKKHFVEKGSCLGSYLLDRRGDSPHCIRRLNGTQLRPGSSGELATMRYSPPFERTERLHMRSYSPPKTTSLVASAVYHEPSSNSCSSCPAPQPA